MANFSNISITQAGAALIAAAVANATKIEFSHIAVGSGELQAGQDITLLTELVFHEVDLPIESMTSEGTAVIVIANLNTATVESPFLHRELGIYAGDVLVAYANAGDDYDAIPAMGGATALSKKIRVALNIAPGATSFRDIDSDEFVTYAGLQARIGAAVQERAAQAASDAVNETIGKAAEDAVRDAAEEGLFKGENAYQLAVGQGYAGTLDEWLASLKGDPGKTAYQEWLAMGFEGSISDYYAWLAQAMSIDLRYTPNSQHAVSGVAMEEYIAQHPQLSKLIANATALLALISK